MREPSCSTLQRARTASESLCCRPSNVLQALLHLFALTRPLKLQHLEQRSHGKHVQQRSTAQVLGCRSNLVEEAPEKRMVIARPTGL
jgi:hypothetical protein